MNLYSLVVCTAAILSATCVFADEENTQDVSEAFENAGLTGENLPAPEAYLGVEFANAEAKLGNCICPARTTLSPDSFTYDGAVPATNYTIVIANCDVPSADAPGLKDYLHALYMNVNGATLSVDAETWVAPWIPINPDPGAGKQRVYELLYEQPGYIDLVDAYLAGLSIRRRKFNLPEFVAKYNLVLVAGNFFRSCLPRQYGKYCSYEYTERRARINDLRCLLNKSL